MKPKHYTVVDFDYRPVFSLASPMLKADAERATGWWHAVVPAKTGRRLAGLHHRKDAEHAEFMARLEAQPPRKVGQI